MGMYDTVCAIPIADFLSYDSVLIKKWTMYRLVGKESVQAVFENNFIQNACTCVGYMFVYVWGCTGHVKICRVGLYTVLCSFLKDFPRYISTVYNNFVCWFLSALIEDFGPVNVGTGKCTIMHGSCCEEPSFSTTCYLNYF